MKKQMLTMLLIIMVCTGQSQAQWVYVGNPGRTSTSLAIDGINVYLGTFRGVFLSTDNGAHWAQSNSGLEPDTAVYCLAATGGKALAATIYGGVYLSMNQGISWKPVLTLPPGKSARVCVIDGQNLLVGGPGVWRSTDGGTNWRQVEFGDPGTYVMALVVSGGKIFAGTNSYGVYCSTDGGSTWEAASGGLTNRFVRTLAVRDSVLFAGTWNGVYSSTNMGASWIPMGPAGFWVDAIAWGGSAMFAGGAYGLQLTTDNGAHWRQKYPLLELDCEELAVSGDVLLTASYSYGAWKRPLLDLTAVADDPSSFPASLVLSQNYPNPFNASTVISYDLPVSGPAHLIVYDALGRHVATLVDETQQRGPHTIRFDCAGIASGVYHYRLDAGGHTSTKRMSLIK